jgi:CDP-diglyceride synthetase
MMDMKNLRTRLLVAAPLIPIGWWAINSRLVFFPNPVAPIYPGQILALFLIVGGCAEYTKLLSLSFPRNRFWLSWAWVIMQMLLDIFDLSMPLRFSLFLLLFIVATEAIFWGEKNSGRWNRASLLFSGTLFLYIAGTSMMNFYLDPFQQLFKRFTPEMVSQMGIVTIVAAVFLSDTAAYVFGSLWGKHHYSTISPNKTIEGSTAGFITAVVTTSVCWYFFRMPGYPEWFGVALGIMTGVAAQAGDLLISLIKRYFRVKNASEILPGHGGVLDRFDSIFFTAPILNLFFVIVTRIVR